VSWRGGRLLGFLCLALYGAVALAFIARSANGALTMPANSDWVAFAVGAHLLKTGGCLYCASSQIATTHAMGLFPGDGINPFVSLPPVGFIFEPLGLQPPVRGIPITLGVSGVMFVAALALTWRLLPASWVGWQRFRRYPRVNGISGRARRVSAAAVGHGARAADHPCSAA
jgi:hypothetical protein